MFSLIPLKFDSTLMRNIASFRNSLTINKKTIDDVVRFLELRRAGLSNKQASAMVNSKISTIKPQRFASEYDQRAKSKEVVKKLLNKNIKTIKRESLIRGLEEYKRNNFNKEITDIVNKELQHYTKIELLSAKIPDPENTKKRELRLKLPTTKKSLKSNLSKPTLKKKSYMWTRTVSNLNQYEEMTKIESIARNKKERLRMLKEQLIKLGKSSYKFTPVLLLSHSRLQLN